MKILVTIKQVPDTATQVKIGSDGKQIDTAGITWIVSPYDEFAVEEALRIKEKRGQGEVVAVSLGPDRVKEALRSALAMGCDRAIHVNDPALAAADTLDDRARAGGGDQAGGAGARALRPPGDRRRHGRDRRPARRGARLAVRVLDHGGGGRRRRQDGARGAPGRGRPRGVRLPLPAVLSAQKGMNEPRYPTLKGIMGAKKKEIKD